MTKPDLKVVSQTPESDVAKAQRLRREAAEIETLILRGALETAAAMATGLRASAELGIVLPGVQNELVRMADDMEQRIEARNLRAFEAANPGVRVVNDAISTQAEYREQVLTSIAAGAPPDVFLLDNIDVPAFTDREVLLDLAGGAA